MRHLPTDLRKRDIARSLLRAPQLDYVLPAQTLAEGHFVLTRKGRLPPDVAARIILDWMEGAIIVDTSSEMIVEALQITARHAVPIFDAIILAAAAEADCDLLYSEDFQHGFLWRGVEVVNPFVGEREKGGVP